MSERDDLLSAIERCEKRAKRWVNLCDTMPCSDCNGMLGLRRC